MESGTSRRMRYFSTFSGIGGFELGIHNAYRATVGGSEEDSSRDDETRSRLVSEEREDISAEDGRLSASIANLLDERPLCVGYSEIDKWADRVYKYHFKGAKNYGDITKINAEELPDFDCLVGGFPCQAFSIAGKRRGFDDTRGTLFFDLARILKAKQPRLFVFENVKGLLSHDEGNTFRTIISTVDELGYDCQWQVLNSKNHGVPQNRERIIIVGHLRGTPRPEVFPLGTADEEDTRVVGQDVAYTIDANYAKGTNTLEKSRRSIVAIPEATKKGYAEATVGQAINLSNPNSQTRRGRVSDVSPTIETSPQIHTLTSDIRLRRLTPLECERLQGFPDYWTETGCDENLACSTCIRQFGIDSDDLVAHGCGGTKIIEISDSQRYKMCGNAVTTNVIQAVFERIFKDGVSN